MTDQDRFDSLLDRAAEAVRDDVPSAQEISAAGARVREQLQSAAGLAPATSRVPITSAEDYITLIPAYLAGQLSPAKAMLLEEEARRSIPLRRALKEARQAGRGTAQELSPVESASFGWTRWVAAAAVLALVAMTAWIAPMYLPGAQAEIARVADIDGTLFQVEGDSLRPLAVGDTFDGRQVVRTAKGSTAVLELDDGSLVEVDERSSLQMVRRRGGNRVRVDRGRIIVQASDQGSGHLWVATEEFLVSVKGTVFAVTHGTKGSRVSVIEGEVVVEQGREAHSVLPGQQLGTRTTLRSTPLEQDFAWSGDVDKYIEMMREVVGLRDDLNQLLESSTRYSTRLLDLAPADAAVYVAVPNATAKIAEAYSLIRERVAENPTFAEAWSEFENSHEMVMMDGVMDHVRELSEFMGEETVFTVSLGQGSDGPLIMSEVLDPAGFRAALEEKLAALTALTAFVNEDGVASDGIPITIIDDPSEATGEGLFVWLVDDLMVASTEPLLLDSVAAALEAGGSNFQGTDFYEMLAAEYFEGMQFLVAVDLELILANEASEEGEELAAIGLANMKHLLIERQQDNGSATTAATVSFEGERQGLASWLAEPGPMGSLEFFSPDATLAAAFVVRDPAELLDELLVLIADQGADTEEGVDQEDIENALLRFEEESGLSLRDDLFAPLGGEFAVGLDGPALPSPSWKVVFEVYDEVTLQNTLERVAEIANQKAQEHAESEGFSVVMSEETVGGRTYYSINGSAPEGSVAETFEGAMEMHWTYTNGYFVGAPSRTLVERAIQYSESGSSLLTAEEFRSQLPEDGYIDFSGVVYNRLGDMLGDVLDALPTEQALTAEQQQAIDELRSDTGASLYCVYGESDKIRFVSHGSSELPLAGISQMMGFGSMIQGVAASPIAQMVNLGGGDEERDPADGGIHWQ